MHLRKTHKYWLVFCSSDKWFKHFLKRGFSHVLIVSNDSKEWFVIDPRSYSLYVEIFNFKIVDNVPKFLSRMKGRTVVEIEISQLNRRMANFPLRLFTCVSLAKYILGVNCRGITPYGVYKNLFKADKIRLASWGITNVKLI